jgi:hypothetical protein
MIYSFYKFVTNLIYNSISEFNSLYLNRLTTAKKISNKLLEIEYLYEGHTFSIYIPIDNRLLTKMVCYDTYIIGKDGQKRKLNIQPGIQTNLTADLLNCKEIVLDNVLTKDIIIFQGKENVTYL